MQISEIPKWQLYQTAKESIYPESLRAWIAHPGSFMRRLGEYGVKDSVVEVVQQRWALPRADERERLGLPPRCYALIREVVIKATENRWMYARTVFPRQTLTGKLQCLGRLKSRSLGSVLFKDPTMLRSEFEVAYFPSMERWARRSLFTLQNKSLLLTEFFLPDLAHL